MKIFRSIGDDKLYYVYEIVRSMCLCSNHPKLIAYPFKHKGNSISMYNKSQLGENFTLVANYNGLP